MAGGEGVSTGGEAEGGAKARTPKRGRRNRAVHWAMVALYVTMLLLFGGLSTWQDYQASLRDSELNTGNYARLLEEHAKRTLEAGDLLLQRLIDHVKAHGLDGVGASRDDWMALAAAVETSPQTGALMLIDAKGIVRFTTRKFPADGGESMVDRDFFRAMAQGAPQPFIGRSFYEPATNKPAFSISRRLSRPDGSFAGVAVATIEMDYFKEFYANLGFSEHVAFGVYKHDGSILVRQPMVEADIGRVIPANAPLLKLMPTKPVGNFRAVSTYDAFNRVVSYRKVDDPALVVWVATTEEDALTEWRGRLARNVIIAAVSLVVMGALSMLVLRGFRREEQATASLAALFDLSPLGMARLHLDGRFIDANRAFQDIVGYSQAELAAMTSHQITPDSYAEEEARQQETLQSEGRYGPFEKELVHRAGRHVPVRLNGMRVHTGGETYLWTIVEDITERLAAEEALRQKTEELSRSNAELEQFAYVASHDLREPLRMVSAYVGLLERRFGDTLGKEGKEFVWFAKEGAERMDKLILSLLEFSRVGRDGHPLVMTPLAPVIRKAVEGLGMAIAESGASIQVDDNLPAVLGDREELTRLFQNLIGNGIKYRQPERKPEIHISARRESVQRWVISVADNGIGIDTEYHERIFGIFQRLHSRGKYEGTGIGLAVCKKIVERSGGEIWVESAPGEGSTFHFTLAASPLAAPQPEPQPEPATA